MTRRTGMQFASLWLAATSAFVGAPAATGDVTRFKQDRFVISYCSNLELMHKYSLKAGIPFWNFFNTLPFGGHTDPTEARIRWQIYASLTYGARGVLCFCYGTPPGNVFISEGAILAREGTLDQARRINARIAKPGAAMLMNYRLSLPAWPTVEFDVPVEQVREVDKRTGKEIPVSDDSPGMPMPGLQMSLDDGEGRLFILPAK